MNRFGKMGSGTTALAAIVVTTLLALAAAGMPDSAVVLDHFAVPPQGQELTFPSAADGPGIEELSRNPVSLLTYGLARIQKRLDHLSDKHEADFSVNYDVKASRIHISVTSRNLKATQENCGKLIRIVQEDASMFLSNVTSYSYFFTNAGEGPANIDSRIDIQATVDNSFDTNALSITDRATCTDGLFTPQD